MRAPVAALLTAVLMTPGLALAQNGSSFIDAASSAVDYTATPWRMAIPCRSLRALTSTAHSVVSADAVPADDDTPAHCRVSGVIPPEIVFELNLPDVWNGRFYMHGNGGYAGGPPEAPGAVRARSQALTRGFATAYTNTGHDSRVEPGALFAHDNLQKLVDYGFRAVHLTAETAKAFIQTAYERAPAYSYWDGCSTGGRQALISAQRFPDDFDGIVAGAPVLDFSGTMIWGAWNGKAALEAGLDVVKMRLVADVVYERCDGVDGLVDGLIDDPRVCDFDARAHLLRCENGGGDSCFTGDEIDALARIYGGVIGNGEVIFPGQPVGAEIDDGWRPWIINGGELPLQTRMSETYFKFMAFTPDEPDHDWRAFDFDQDPARIGEARRIIDATDPDLTAFRAAGGKMLSHFGWADTALNPMMGVDYYESVTATMGGDTTDFYRLFMVPGMFHCRGGVGTDRFDLVTPLVNWVEGGVAPDRIGASRVEAGNVVRTRPLCPYPQVARHTGSGSIDEASSFVCVNPGGAKAPPLRP